jgi:hypothetical protein
MSFACRFSTVTMERAGDRSSFSALLFVLRFFPNVHFFPPTGPDAASFSVGETSSG